MLKKSLILTNSCIVSEGEMHKSLLYKINHGEKNSDKALKCTVENWTYLFLNEGSLEITSTVPLILPLSSMFF